MKASTLYKMVEDVTDLNGDLAKLVFLTNKQASICCKTPENLGRFIEALDMPKPQLVIQLEYSLGLKYFQQLLRVPAYYPGLENLKLDPLSLPWGDVVEAVEARARLVKFMGEVLIPLAEQTNALIIVSGSNQCELTNALGRAMAMRRAKWGARIPFTIMAVEHRMAELYTYGEGESSLWWSFMKQSREWSLRHKRILEHVREYSLQSKQKLVTAFDLNPNANIFIVLDGIDEGKGQKN